MRLQRCCCSFDALNPGGGLNVAIAERRRRHGDLPGDEQTVDRRVGERVAVHGRNLLIAGKRGAKQNPGRRAFVRERPGVGVLAGDYESGVATRVGGLSGSLFFNTTEIRAISPSGASWPYLKTFPLNLMPLPPLGVFRPATHDDEQFAVPVVSRFE
jgi:hypothetical protein